MLLFQNLMPGGIKIKKLLTVSIVFVILLSLAACSQNGDTPDISAIDTVAMGYPIQSYRAMITEEASVNYLVEQYQGLSFSKNAQDYPEGNPFWVLYYSGDNNEISLIIIDENHYGKAEDNFSKYYPVVAGELDYDSIMKIYKGDNGQQ